MDKARKNSFLTLLLLLSACSKQERSFKRIILPFFKSSSTVAISNNSSDVEAQSSAHNITIWIHGTRLWPITIFKGYWDPNPTLIKVASMKKDYYLRRIADTLCTVGAEFDLEDFYFLRWSGKLSVSEREETAFYLYKAVKELVEKYKEQYQVTPTITVVTHSHGGNVALNLSKITDKDAEIKIKRLILLACPVQKHTQEFINDNIFENVYSFYSTLDLMQILDPQGLHHNVDGTRRRTGLFSGRNFPKSSKLCNVKIKINGRGMWHNQFLSKEFVMILPQVINKLDEWKRYETHSQYFISVTLKK